MTRSQVASLVFRTLASVIQFRKTLGQVTPSQLPSNGGSGTHVLIAKYYCITLHRAFYGMGRLCNDLRMCLTGFREHLAGLDCSDRINII